MGQLPNDFGRKNVFYGGGKPSEPVSGKMLGSMRKKPGNVTLFVRRVFSRRNVEPLSSTRIIGRLTVLPNNCILILDLSWLCARTAAAKPPCSVLNASW